MVYPACAGIHPLKPSICLICFGLPRMRGDPPSALRSSPVGSRSTPHARGSTFPYLVYRMEIRVYPACAGIHPRAEPDAQDMYSLPRMRGDPPTSFHPRSLLSLSTPHARGSTQGDADYRYPSSVYPACAGIHPSSELFRDITVCLPRMRGDPPLFLGDWHALAMSTPHARGST